MAMDTGTEHEIRQRLARERETEVRAYLKDARGGGDADRVRLAEYALDRCGIEIGGVDAECRAGLELKFG
jgi:hypothetical protein